MKWECGVGRHIESAPEVIGNIVNGASHSHRHMFVSLCELRFHLLKVHSPKSIEKALLQAVDKLSFGRRDASPREVTELVVLWCF